MTGAGGVGYSKNKNMIVFCDINFKITSIKQSNSKESGINSQKKHTILIQISPNFVIEYNLVLRKYTCCIYYREIYERWVIVVGVGVMRPNNCVLR